MFFNNYFKKMAQSILVDKDKDLLEGVKLIQACSKENKKVIIIGNGGSSAIASHVSVDFTKAAKVRAINFNESDLITCFGNDYGYENWLTEALKAYADEGDLLILISSSGKSPNILNAAKFAIQNKIKLITLTGFDSSNPISKLGNINYWVDSNSYNIVEMTHHIWLLSFVDYIVENGKQ